MNRRLAEEKGMVLLLVLVVVALVSSLLVEFAFSTLVDLRLTETFRDTTRAYYLAKGGIQVGRMLLAQNTNTWDSLDQMWAQGVTNYPVADDAWVSIHIEDLGGKLDINRLITSSDNPNTVVAEQFVRLFSELGLDRPEDLTAALIDWIDKNQEVFQGVEIKGTGAETNYYQSLEHPYPCKDGPMDSLDELPLVRGFTPQVCKLVLPFVTVYGSDKININTASPEVLQALSDQVSPDDADAIVAARKTAPFKNVTELKDLAGMDTVYSALAGAPGLIATTSETFRIIASGGVGDGARRAEAVVKKQGNQLLYFKVE